MSNQTITSEKTGLAYDVSMHVKKDMCAKCGGFGFVTYATPADEAAYELEMEGVDPDDYYPEMNETGRKDCDRCDGTGKNPADGDTISFAIRASGRLITVPS
jgi:hypothetical protein